MRKFILRAVLFALVFFALDYGFSLFLESNRPIDYKLFLDSKKEYFETDDSIDILLIGDSHIADALDPRIIESETTFSSFNLGVYHSSPFENYYITKAALEKSNQKPKVIVLGTNPSMFESGLSKGKYTPLIIPKSIEFEYASEEGLDADFFLKSFKEKYLIRPVISKLLGKPYTPTRDIQDVYRGHSQFYNQIPGTKWSGFDSSKVSRVNVNQVEYFVKTIDLIQSYDIPIILVHPPIWQSHLDALSGTESYAEFKKEIGKVTRKYELEVFYNYLDDPTDDDLLTFSQSDFLNSQHLNYHGSEKFTREFAKFLTLSKSIQVQ